MDRWLENNTVLKIVSVVVAIFLWLQVQQSSTASLNKTVGPVTITWTSPPNTRLNVMSIQPSVASIQIKGSPRAMSNVSAHNVTAWVNLSRLTRPGTYTLRVVASVPPGTSLVNVSPSEVIVHVDTIGTRKMSVDLKPQGTPKSSDEVASLSSSSTTAVVSGPSVYLDQVRKLVGEVPVAGKGSTVSTQVLLLPLNADGHLVPHLEVSPPSVTATAVIKPRPPQKTVSVVAKLLGHPATGYVVKNIRVSPLQVDITASHKSALSSINTVNTVPIDITGLKRGISESIPLSLPSGISTLGSPDVTVSVTIGR